MLSYSCDNESKECDCTTTEQSIYASRDGNDDDDDEDDDEKVKVCHNGNTIEIDEEDLQDHLDHGDVQGECTTLSIEEYEFDYEFDCSDDGLEINMNGRVLIVECN